MKRRFFSILTALALCLSLLPRLALADGGTGESTGDHTDHCVCGATHTDVGNHTAENKLTGWQAISTGEALAAVSASGNYYLSADVTLSSMWTIPNGRDIVLCLNGHTLTADNRNVGDTITIEGKLTITDCKANGTITGTNPSSATDTGNHKVLVVSTVYADCTLNLYGGTITGIHSGSGYDGGGVRNEGTFNMYGGTITGNSARSGGGVDNVLNHGASTYKGAGKFNLYGGTITGNTATSGAGNDVHVGTGSTMNATGGTVGEVAVVTGGNLEKSGTSITAVVTPVSTAEALSAAVSSDGTVKLTNDIDISSTLGISKKVTLDLNGHVLKMTGDTGSVIAVSYGNLTLTDSNSAAPHSDTTLPNGGVITGGSGDSTDGRGGGVHVSQSTFTMKGGSIVGCTASHGGGVYVTYSTFTMEGGSIVGCTAYVSTSGNGVCVQSNGSFHMMGGTISDSTSTATSKASNVLCIDPGTNASAPPTMPLEADGGAVYGSVFTFSTITNTSEKKNTATVFYGGLDNAAKISGLKVTFQNGTDVYAWEVVQSGGKAVKPTDPAGTGRFIGWYLQNDEGSETTYTAYDFSSPVTESITLYANWDCQLAHSGTLGDWQKDADGHWKTYSCCPNVKVEESAHSFGENGKCVCGAVQYTVTFDPNGGSVDTASATTDIFGKLAELPTPTRSGYSFDGWFTAQNGGTEVTTDTVFEESTTVYAQWSYDAPAPAPVPAPAVYTVTVLPAENGSAASSHQTARKGATVTITVTPDKGYTLETLTVLDRNGREIELTALGDGEYTFRMPASSVTVTATFMEDNTMLNFFVDVTADQYYYDAVLWAVQNGITTGVDENHFGPDQSCNRAQLAAFLYRYVQAQGGGFTGAWMFRLSFTDVPDWCFEPVAWCYMNGIVKGYSEDTFAPGEDVTREQFVTILYRFAVATGMDVSVGEDTNILSYNDVFEVSEYAVEAMQWAVGAGIVQGDGANLMPGQPCTRAQIVTMLYRLLGE